MIAHQVSSDPLQIHELVLAIIAFGSTGLMFLRFKISVYYNKLKNFFKKN